MLVVLFWLVLHKEIQNRSSQVRTSIEECHLAGLVCAQTNTHMVLKGGVGHHGYILMKRLLMLNQVHASASDASVRRLHGLGNINGNNNLYLSIPCRRARQTSVRREALDLLEWSRWTGDLDLVWIGSSRIWASNLWFSKELCSSVLLMEFALDDISQGVRIIIYEY